MRFGALLLLVVGVGVAICNPTPKDEKPIIDGKNNTVANVITDYLLGLIPNADIAELIRMLIEAFTAPEFDYWGNVKADVEAVVGTYINDHNMHQVEVYQGDLQVLMQRYSNAPVESTTYPDKNLQAAALSTSVIAHRYLTEAAVMKESLILHYEDIASIHVAILKDVAETYSPQGATPSHWWVDLDTELDHYISYGELLKKDLSLWRMGQVICNQQIADWTCTNWEWAGKICYDTYTATDLVTGENSMCKALHEEHSCDDHCQLFQDHKKQELQTFYKARVTGVLQGWKDLKVISADMADKASSFYDPIRMH